MEGVGVREGGALRGTPSRGAPRGTYGGMAGSPEEMKRKKVHSGNRRIELAPTEAIDRLTPQVDEILRALAEVCDEPGFAEALVTDESWFSDFGLDADQYAKLSAMLRIEVDPAREDDRYI